MSLTGSECRLLDFPTTMKKKHTVDLHTKQSRHGGRMPRMDAVLQR